MDSNLEITVSTLFPAFEIILSRKDLEILTNATENELPSFHFGLGLYIRNNILNLESTLYSVLMESGLMCKDDMSTIIIKLFHQYLNKKAYSI